MSQDAVSTLAVLMFTDIVGSVDLKQRLGGADASERISRHDRIFKAVIADIPGATIVQDTGDGFLAQFATPSDAVAGALAFQAAIRAQQWGGDPLRVRVGIHMGEVTPVTDSQAGRTKYIGLAIDLTARVMGIATGGQILMTGAVDHDARQFVRAHPSALAGERQEVPSLRWMAYGTYRFKGYDDPLEIFEVGAAGGAPFIVPPASEKGWPVVSDEERELLGWRPGVGLDVPMRAGWRLERKLGEGGFGEVWLAVHSRLRSRRVFKFCFDAERLRSFKRELVIFRLIRDALGDRSDIARLYDVQFDTPPYFIESEFTEPGNLAEWGEAQGGIAAVGLETRIDITARIADAVAAAHSVGVLHKDIKPSNILIAMDEDGSARPRLADFGIGIVTDRTMLAGRAITATGITEAQLTANESSRTGTRMYAPPESLTGKPFTVQGDVYALGVLLYQMVIGDFAQPLAAGWERNIADPMLREDIAVCVDGDASRRLSSAAELAERLRALASRRTAHVRARRQRQLWRGAMVGLGVLAVLAGLLGWAYLRENQVRLRETAAKEREAAAKRSSERVAEALSEGIINILNPTFGLPENMKAAVSIEQQIRKADAEEALPPEILSKPLHVVGRVYRRLGAYDQAERVLKEALDLRMGVFGPDNRFTLSSAFEHAGAVHQLGRLQEALPLKRDVLARRTALLGAGDVSTLNAANDLAMLLMDLDQLDESATLLQRVVEADCGPDAKPGAAGAENDRCANAKLNLGRCFTLMGRFDLAEVLLNDAYERRKADLPPDHPFIASVMSRIGGLRYEQGRFQEAVSDQQRAIEIRRIKLGATHEFTLNSMCELAQALAARNELGDIERARGLFDEVVKSAEASTSLGPAHWLTASFRLQRARFLLKQGQTDAARVDIDAAKVVFEGVLPAGHRLRRLLDASAALVPGK